MSEWISVKDRLPEIDCVCVVYNSSRPSQYYISIYNKFFNEFGVYTISHIKLVDGISFNATHWMPLPKSPN